MMFKRLIATILVFTMTFSTCVFAAENTKKDDANNNIEPGLTAEQNNSVVMLNYLTTVTTEINESSNSKLYLENAYSSILNNTSPKVDEDTQYYLNNLLNTLHSYRMIDVKRERLEYIYEQNKAQAIRDAMPNPLGLLSVVQSFSLKKIVASVVYMAVDSYTSYSSSKSDADLQYLKDGWELDDAQANTLHNSSLQLFNYMLDMSREYSIPAEYSLTEESVKEFVKWENTKNIVQKLQFLENNKKTYEKFGNYWLVLAKTYYDAADKGYDEDGYEKCLKAIAEYENLNVSIFRKDHEYVSVLPIAISAAAETMTKPQYVEFADKYSQKILNNTSNDEWALRYFAAQTYIDLYTKTKGDFYLKKAYDITLNNVNELVSEQKTQNAEYLADIVEEKIPEDSTKQEKQDIKQYNKMIKEQRKKELPPVYEPLILNCDLLFALAGQIDIKQSEKKKIENILREDGEPLFLTKSLDDLYSFSDIVSEQYDISFDGKNVMIPAKCLSDSSILKVTVFDGDGTPFEDVELVEVDRAKQKNIDNFVATYSSKELSKYKYTGDSVIQIDLVPVEGSNCQNISASFKVAEMKKFAFLIDNPVFERVE